jgi:hypothetical protein
MLFVWVGVNSMYQKEVPTMAKNYASTVSCPHCGGKHSSTNAVKNCKKATARKKGKSGKRK